MASHARPPRHSSQQPTRRIIPERPAAPRRLHMRATSPIVMPLVVLCSVAMSTCMAFGNPVLWMSADQQAALEVSDQPAPTPAPEEEAPTPENPADPNQQVIGEYQAISQSEDEARCENIRLAAEAIDGTVIAPGEEFSFNEVVGDTTASRGYEEASVISNGEVSLGMGGGVCQVSTALYIAAVKADLEIIERHPHSIPSDYAPIGLDATITYDQLDLRIKNNTDHDITIHAKALGQTVEVSIVGDPLEEGRSIDATSHIVSQYEKEDDQGKMRQYYVTESFRVYYQYGNRTTRDFLSSDIYLITEDSEVVLAEGSVEPNK